MKKLIKKFDFFNLLRIYNKKKKTNLYKKEFKIIEFENNSKQRFNINWAERYPILNEKKEISGFDRHYIYHPAWAAQILKHTKPEKHIDIGSSLHFSSLISAFIKVEFYDFHTVDLKLKNLSVARTNLTDLHFTVNSINSLSCMHVVEHIGLGRYGDKLDYDGDIKAIKELSRVLAPNGNLLFVVPVGKEAKIMFNAHRIYKPQQIIELFSLENLKLKEFTLIPEKNEDGGLVKNPDKALLSKQNYACGCFWFKK